MYRRTLSLNASKSKVPVLEDDHSSRNVLNSNDPEVLKKLRLLEMMSRMAGGRR